MVDSFGKPLLRLGKLVGSLVELLLELGGGTARTCCGWGIAALDLGRLTADAFSQLRRPSLRRCSKWPFHQCNRRDDWPPSHEALPRRSEPRQG